MSTATDIDVTEEIRDIIMAAYRVARDEQLRTVKALKTQLAWLFPRTAEATIDTALRYWAQQMVTSGTAL